MMPCEIGSWWRFMQHHSVRHAPTPEPHLLSQPTEPLRLDSVPAVSFMCCSDDVACWKHYPLTMHLSPHVEHSCPDCSDLQAGSCISMQQSYNNTLVYDKRSMSVCAHLLSAG